MKIDKKTNAIISLIFGFLIIFNQGILAWLIGIYLLIIGVIGLIK